MCLDQGGSQLCLPQHGPDTLRADREQLPHHPHSLLLSGDEDHQHGRVPDVGQFLLGLNQVSNELRHLPLHVGAFD